MVDEPGRKPAPVCTFCETDRTHRSMMMVNEKGTCAICDVCVLALYPLVRVQYAAHGNPYAIPEGKPN